MNSAISANSTEGSATTPDNVMGLGMKVTLDTRDILDRDTENNFVNTENNAAEMSGEGSGSSPETPSPRRKPPKQLRPWRPGQSGNPGGRPKIEPAVRKLARTKDKQMVDVLVSIAENPEVAPSERRKAAVALIEIGSGKAEFTQCVSKSGQPLLGVNFNMASAPGQVWDPATAYRLMVNGTLDADANHPAFADRPALEVTGTAALPPAGDEVSE